MLAKGKIPEDIKRLFEEGSQSGINRMFKVGKDGQYVLCTDTPEFYSWRRNVDTKFATAESVSEGPILQNALASFPRQ